MSAERLREAAAVLRERAEAATAGPWAQPSCARHMLVAGDFENVIVARQVSVANTPYIATVHPGVALRFAVLLDAVAEHVGSFDCHAHCEYPDGCDTTKAALAVADAILGGAS